MPIREAYLIRWEDGTIRTVQAHSVKGAAGLFVATYAAPVGSRFGVKVRGGSESWAWFSRTSVGVRRVSAPDAATM